MYSASKIRMIAMFYENNDNKFEINEMQFSDSTLVERRLETRVSYANTHTMILLI